MKYTFYGTAAAEGIPAIFCECEACNRARKLGGKNIMTRSQSVIDGVLGIDFSADSYLHVINYGMPERDISSYLITHNHMDHFYLDDLDAFEYPVSNVICYANYYSKLSYNNYNRDTNFYLGTQYMPLRNMYQKVS